MDNNDIHWMNRYPVNKCKQSKPCTLSAGAELHRGCICSTDDVKQVNNSWIQNFLLTEERELELRGLTVVLLPQGKRKR